MVSNWNFSYFLISPLLIKNKLFMIFFMITTAMIAEKLQCTSCQKNIVEIFSLNFRYFTTILHNI